MTEKPYTKTRIIESPAYNGKWVVQGWWPTTEVWADLGDPCETYVDAVLKLGEITED